ncbi:hypothetical protein [Actinoplanes sp. NBRC 103695]|uniref:hypothetical protein n=1 Tax=Actinoplanes sp. NBRC 103695 TaxID=3032202 RepID=UPI0025568641|nr:hypothetical protein [Actinoplanes sp. NBRC 103695]
MSEVLEMPVKYRGFKGSPVWTRAGCWCLGRLRRARSTMTVFPQSVTGKHTRRGRLFFLGKGDQLTDSVTHGGQPHQAAGLVDGGFGSGGDQDRPKGT